MIYDTLNHRKQYQSVHPGVAAALDALADTDWSAVPDGRYKADNPTPERHEKYIDIFYLLEGEEEVAVCPVEELGEVVEARPEGDIWLHKGTGVRLPLGGGRFLALFPGDGHAPSIGPNGPAPARKCVAKVRV